MATASKLTQALYEENYVKRGDMESLIKAPQRMLFANRANCHDSAKISTLYAC